MDDAALLTAWRGGNRSAGDELIRKYYKPLFQFFFSKVGGNTARSEDLVQRTFETLVRKQEAIGESFRAFMYGIARFKLLEARRPARPGDAGAESAAADDVASSGRGVDSVLAEVESRKREEDLVARALRSLSDSDQILLELKDLEGFTSRELGEIMDVNPNQIRGLINRARDRLKRQVETLSASDEVKRSTLRQLKTWMQSVHRRIGENHPSLARHLAERKE